MTPTLPEAGIAGLALLVTLQVLQTFRAERHVKNGNHPITEAMRELGEIMRDEHGKTRTVLYNVGRTLADHSTKLDDLHRWHSPNSNGEQTWKQQRCDAGDLKEPLRELQHAADRLTDR